MRKMKLFIFILLAIISSFLFTNGIIAYTKATDSITNTFTLTTELTRRISVTYYSIYGNVKTQVKNTKTTTYNINDTILKTDLLKNLQDYDDVKIYIDNVEFTGTTYTVTKNANIEIDLIYTTTTFNSIYVDLNEKTFTGSNHLDTGIYYQTQDALDKDYDIIFDITYIDPANKTSGQEQPTIMTAKDEDNTLYPGNVVRLNTRSTDPLQVSGRWNNTRTTKNITTDGTTMHVIITRRSGQVRGRVITDNSDSGNFNLYNQNNWTINQYTNNTVTFGARQVGGSYDRYFIGKIENIQVLLFE